MTVFLGIVAGVFGLFHVLAYRFWLVWGVERESLRRILKIALTINYIANLCYFAVRYEVAVPLWLYYILSWSIGLSFALFLATLVAWLLYASLKIPLRHSRRENLKSMAAIGGGVFVAGYTTAATHEGYARPLVVRVPLSLPHLQQPFTAVQLSDLHIGGLIGYEYVQLLVQEVNALEADVIFLTGDMTDSPVEEIKEIIALLGGLKAPLGVYYVVGNHEYFHGVMEVVHAMSLTGARVLLNESVYLSNGVNVVGVNDVFGYRMGILEPDLPKAIEQIQPSMPTILLAHQPKFAKDLLMNGDYPIDLVLSGHTHGGQIFPFSFLVVLQQGFLKGLYRLNERTQLYVNSGTGFWGPPMRLGSHAEITLFEFS